MIVTEHFKIPLSWSKSLIMLITEKPDAAG